MLKTDKLTYHYEDGAKGIEDVSFSADHGKIIGVIGENGAGKSTFFKCLLGLLKPQSGQLFIEEQAISFDKKSLKKLRRTINLVMQDPERQIFYSSVFDDIALGPKNLGYSETEIQKITNECISAVKAESFASKPVQYLSFGQKKRVAIAGVLALSCNVLLLDEPETGLDPKMRQEMIMLLRSLSESGKKIIISSHNMDMIYELCDYVYIMHEGTFICEGPVDSVMTNEVKLKKAHLEMPLLVKLAGKLGMKTREVKALLQSEL